MRQRSSGRRARDPSRADRDPRASHRGAIPRRAIHVEDCLAAPTLTPAAGRTGASTVAESAVRLVDLTKAFEAAVGRRVAAAGAGTPGASSVVAVDHVDLDVRDGEFFSMLG